MTTTEKFQLVKLKQLFLDPNNYRLRTHPNYRPVNKSSEIKPSIQQRTYNMLAGENNFDIADLIESFKANGYLKVDHILVREHIDREKKSKDKKVIDQEKNYVIIEGNRRLAALKYLSQQFQNDYDIGKISPNIFKEGDKDGIEVIVHEYPDETDYLILMGLRHVSGNKKWDVYNQAKLVFELNSKGYNNLDIAKKIGIKPKSRVEELLRGYYAIEDFIEYVKDENLDSLINPHDKFMMFVELTQQPKLRKWIGWDDKNFKMKNINEKKRFFNWIQPIPKSDIENESENFTATEPYIKNHKQIRELDDLIDDEKFLKKMEDYGSFDAAKNESPNYKNKQFSEVLKNTEQQFKTFSYGFISSLNEDNKKILQRLKEMIAKFLQESS